MLKFIKKEKFTIGLFTLILLGYLITRLINLGLIPIFTDEAIYAFWSKVALTDPQNRFISLTDGKQPSFVWLGAIFQIYIKDPLIAIRLVSVVSGLFATVGMFLLGKEVINKQVGTIAAFLYVILPFTLLYDRLGLYDSLLTSIGIWTIILSIRLVKDPKLDTSLLAGLAFGLGQVTKSSANLFLYSLPFSLILFNFKSERKLSNFIKWIFLATLAAFISFVIYNLLRVSQYFYIINRKNLEFIRPISEVLQNPLLLVFSNSKTIVFWLIDYSGILLIALLIATIIYGFVKRNKQIIYLTTIITLPIVAIVLFNKILYPRFLLFFYPYIITIISYGFYKLQSLVKNKATFITLAAIILAMPMFQSFNIITNPLKAKLPYADAFQLRDGWPAGYGVKEIVEYLKNESKDKKVIVGTEGTFGLYPYALNIYFFDNKNLEVQAFWPVNPKALPSDMLNKSKQTKTFFIFNENQSNIDNPNLKLISRYKKGNGESYMRLYEVTPL